MQFQGLVEIRKSWSEKEFQAQVLAAARTLGWELQYHTYDSRRSQKGWPDLVLIHPEKRLLVIWELKTEKGIVGPDQLEWMHGLRGVLGGQPNVLVGIRRPRDLDLMLKELQGEFNHLERPVTQSA